MSDAEFSLSKLQAKYAAERSKRLRADATGQYLSLEDTFAELNVDPYTPWLAREAIVEEIDVAIIGGGIGGLVAAARLSERGVTNIRVIDKAGDFGGTWYWNRYPGAACDVVSYIYLPLLEETGYVPVEKYAKAPEIFAHCQRIARMFNLYDKAMFQTEIDNLVWQEHTGRWRISTDRGDSLNARLSSSRVAYSIKPSCPASQASRLSKVTAFTPVDGTMPTQVAARASLWTS